MPGNMAIKGSLFRQVSEELTSLRMDIKIRLDNDGRKETPIAVHTSWYLLIFVFTPVWVLGESWIVGGRRGRGRVGL